MAKPSDKPAPGVKPAQQSQPQQPKQPSKPVARTDVRNSPVPQAAPAGVRPSVQSKPAVGKPATPAAPAAAAARPAASQAARPVSHELIARRAYEIWASGQGGSDTENWIRAERELRGL